MTIKVTKTVPRERASSQNGMPEPVRYVYRAQERRNTYAARIARRNAAGLPQSLVLAAGVDEVPRVAVRPWSPRGDPRGLDVLGTEHGVNG